MIRFSICLLCVVFLTSNSFASGKEKEPNDAGYFFAAGVPLIGAGLIGIASAAAWDPVVQDFQNQIDILNESDQPTDEVAGLLSDVKKKQDNIELFSKACIATGVAAIVLGIVKEAWKEPKSGLTILPTVSNGAPTLLASLKF